MTAFSREDLSADVVAVLDDVAATLSSALTVPAYAAAREAKVDHRTLARFLDREQGSIQLSTLVRVCLRNGLALRIEIEPQGAPHKRTTKRRPRS